MNINRTNVLAAYGIVVTFIAGIAILLLMQKSALLDARRYAVVRQAVTEGRLSHQETHDIIGFDVGGMNPATAGDATNQVQPLDVADEIVTTDAADVFEEPEQPRDKISENTQPADSSGSSWKHERNTGSGPPMMGSPGLGQPGRELIADPR